MRKYKALLYKSVELIISLESLKNSQRQNFKQSILNNKRDLGLKRYQNDKDY